MPYLGIELLLADGITQVRPMPMIVHPLDKDTAENPYDGRALLQCHITPYHILLAQSYNLILCIVTTAYSFLTRKLPENFNESR